MLARPAYYPIKLQHTWLELERTDRRGKGTKNIGSTCSSNTCPVDHLEMFEAENPSDCFGCMFGVGVQLCGTKIKRLWTKWATSPTFFHPKYIWTHLNLLTVKCQHFNLMVIGWFQIQFAGLEKNNWKCIIMEIHMGHTVHRVPVRKC